MKTLTNSDFGVKPRAFPYFRWSSPAQTDGSSKSRQGNPVADYCERHGLEMQDPAIDAGKSARRGDNRKNGALAALLEKVRSGDFILIEDNDRWSRENPLIALNALEQVVRRGVTIVFISTGLKVTAENFFELSVFLQNSLKAFFAHEENERKSIRVRAGWRALKEGAAQGKIMTKATPAWLRVNDKTGKFATVEPHVSTLKRIFREYADGKGIRTIMREFNEEKIPSFGRGKQNNGKWSNTHLRRLLASRNVLGEYQPHEYIDKKKRVPEGPAIPYYYPAVIDTATFYRVQGILEKNGHPTGRRRDRVTNLFTNLIKCAKCGGSMVVKRSPAQHGRYYYVSLVCSNGIHNVTKCGFNSIQNEWVERAVLTLLWSKIVPLMKERDSGQEQLAAKAGELAHTQKALATYEAKLMDPELASDAMLKAIKGLEVKQAELTLQVESLKARVENNPLAGWKPVPKSTENRLKLQTILAGEIAGLSIDAEKLTGTLKVTDPETEFDLKWERGQKDTFQSLGEKFSYLDEMFVWESDKYHVRIELKEAA